MPICILGDSLYACEKVFERCDWYNWHYIFSFKERQIKSIANDLQAIKQWENRQADIVWVKNIPYNDRTVHIVEYEEARNESKFTYLTNIKITKKNSFRLIAAGRSRWKIENEGFNKQKNARYHIEHANSHDYTAMKNQYHSNTDNRYSDATI